MFDFATRYKLKESVKWDDFSLLVDEWMGPMLWYDKEMVGILCAPYLVLPQRDASNPSTLNPQP